MTRDPNKADAVAEVMKLFDQVIESSKEGIRKPNPQIYLTACERLGVQPHNAVFLDDLGINLKPARELGMQTIKVLSEAQAIDDLAKLTGLTFD
jgi:putative hydrolase of the HAD superfamily